MFALLPFLFAIHRIHTFQQQQYYKMYSGLTVVDADSVYRSLTMRMTA